MTPTALTATLTDLFGAAVQTVATDSYQIETEAFRLLVLVSEDHAWLRLLTPITPLPAAQPFLEQLLAANFDLTQEARYAIHQEILWAVFYHSLEGLTVNDFTSAVQRLQILHQEGMDEFFNTIVEQQIRQIIQIAKQQGQSLETTMQMINRGYEEGLLGELTMGNRSREENIAAWQRQLTRLWPEV
jgi:hypothetical protein